MQVMRVNNSETFVNRKDTLLTGEFPTLTINDIPREGKFVFRGRKSVGKTQLCYSLINEYLKSGKSVTVFSREGELTDVIVLCAVAEVESQGGHSNLPDYFKKTELALLELVKFDHNLLTVVQVDNYFEWSGPSNTSDVVVFLEIPRDDVLVDQFISPNIDKFNSFLGCLVPKRNQAILFDCEKAKLSIHSSLHSIRVTSVKTEVGLVVDVEIQGKVYERLLHSN